MQKLNKTGPSPYHCKMLQVIGSQFGSFPSNLAAPVQLLKKLANPVKDIGMSLESDLFLEENVVIGTAEFLFKIDKQTMNIGVVFKKPSF